MFVILSLTLLATKLCIGSQSICVDFRQFMELVIFLQRACSHSYMIIRIHVSGTCYYQYK